MYLKALDNGLIVLDTGVEFLSIANLPTFVSFLGSKNELSYEMCRSVKSPVQGQGKTTSPVMVTPNNENGNRPIVIESFRAQKNTVVSMEAQNVIDLPIVVEPIEAQNKVDLPIVVEPVEAQNKVDLPIVVELVEAQNNDNLPISVEPSEVENENQVWFIKYRKELQGLVITDREIESHYYDIHTALSNTFLKNSCAILILEGYMMS